jgi:hypothetical protein
MSEKLTKLLLFLGFGALFHRFFLMGSSCNKIRDESVTVFMVKKYLVGKLGLSNEDEVIYFSFSL